MSGNSGGGYYRGSGSSSSNCNNIAVKGTVSSPDPAVLATLTVGDKVDIIVRTTTGPLQAVTKDARVLGSVLVASANTIIECIAEGNSFEGTITLIRGGHCELLITNK
jgi:hypothetical protein